MKKIKVVFKNGGTLDFAVKDAELYTNKDNQAQLVGYKFDTEDTYTSVIFIDPTAVAGVLIEQEELVTNTAPEASDLPSDQVETLT